MVPNGFCRRQSDPTALRMPLLSFGFSRFLVEICRGTMETADSSAVLSSGSAGVLARRFVIRRDASQRTGEEACALRPYISLNAPSIRIRLNSPLFYERRAPRLELLGARPTPTIIENPELT